MKKCSEIKEFISLYIDNQLEPDEHKILDDHLESCEECRHELNELKQIVGHCNNFIMEELPHDFKTELHKKLQEAQEQLAGSVKPAFYQTRQFRLITSVAAVFLLVFLIRGFYFSDLFPSGTSSNYTDNINLAAQSPANDSVQYKAALPEDSGGVEKNFSIAGGSGSEQFTDTVKDAIDGGNEIDRSANDDKEPRISLNVDETGNESVSKNTTSITVAVDDPETQIMNIKDIAIRNSGQEQPIEQYSETNPEQAEEGSVSLYFGIPNMQLSALIDALSADYGQSNVQPGAIITEDMSIKMEELLKQSDALDIEIEKLKNGENTKQKDLDELSEAKVEIQNIIDTIRLGTDITITEIKLIKK